MEKYPVTAMSYTRAKAEDVITGQAEHLASHVMKLLVFPHATFVKHWTMEIRAVYVRCSLYGNNVKGGKTCKLNDYWAWLFVPPFRRDSLIIEERDLAILLNTKIKARTVADEKAITTVKDFYAAMCKSLAADQDWSVFAHSLEILTA
jgi:hypothetical protein